MQPTTTIEHFDKTITNAILSINTVIFLCLLGMAFAMTTIQPIHLMVSLKHFEAGPYSTIENKIALP